MRTHYGKATWETEFTQYPFFWSQNENAKVNFSFSLHSSFLSFGLFLLRFKTTYYFPPFKSEKEITKSSVGKGKLSIKRAEYPKAEAWFIAPACRRFILRVVKGKISTSLHNLLSKLMKFLVKRYYCHVSNWKKNPRNYILINTSQCLKLYNLSMVIKISIKADSKNRETTCFLRPRASPMFLASLLITDYRWQQEKVNSPQKSKLRYLFLKFLLISVY